MSEDIEVFSDGRLFFKGQTYRCALGKGGVVSDKKEGDGATPTGIFALRTLLYRPDRLVKPVSKLNAKALSATDGWCDDPDHELYNSPVTRPFEGRHEDLWRDDSIYDIIVVLGYNDNPPVKGKGSAIFFHLARENFEPTEGCVAVKAADMLEILTHLSEKTRLVVNP